MAITLSYPEGGMLVTGGTGRVGKGIVRRLAEAGVPLVFTYRGNKAEAEAMVEALRAAGHRVWTQQMEMTDSGAIQAALDRVIAECGTIHGIACGAGWQVKFDKIADFPIDYVERFVNADALGYYRVFHAAIPMLRARGGGTITTCTTMATRRVIDYDGVSPFSKASIDALIRQVAAEEAPAGIRCNGVAIGWVEDRSIDQAKVDYGPKPENPQTEDERVSALMHQLFTLASMKRPVTSEEAGNTFAFLASNEARHLTGQTLDLDAGCLL